MMSATMTPHRAATRRTTADAWHAVQARDAAWDGALVFAVRTTGIYCRPSCPARRPNRTNVEFFEEPRAARAAGYRPCLRCDPDGVRDTVDPIAEAHRIMHERGGERTTLRELAHRVGLSPFHLQRRFKERYGASPKALERAYRARRFRLALKGTGSVARATYDAGYGSSSRAYEAASSNLGMTPARYAKGGAGLVIRYAVGRTRLGRLLVAATDRGLCAVLFGDTKEQVSRALREEFPNARLREAPADSSLTRLLDQIADRLSGAATEIPVELDLVGTDFQDRVWRALLEIPRGATRTYAEIAQTIGRPTATRAVARAIATNRLAGVVPCHRVVRGDGELGGYRWGAERKRQILAAEGVRSPA